MTTASPALKTREQVPSAPSGLRDVPPDAAALVPLPSPQQPTPEAPAATTRTSLPAQPAAIFTPERRSFWSRYGTPLLVMGSLACGALLHEGITRLRLFAPKASVAAGAPFRLAAPITLRGPGGPVTLPMSVPVVVNIWLQDCADCQPAVDAWQAIQEEQGLAALELPVVNVAFGGANVDWASLHKLQDRLVFDPSGGALVRPMGIGSFTTVIMDETGTIRLKDRPDQPGFAQRLIGAARVLQTQPRK